MFLFWSLFRFFFFRKGKVTVIDKYMNRNKNNRGNTITFVYRYMYNPFRWFLLILIGPIYSSKIALLLFKKEFLIKNLTEVLFSLESSCCDGNFRNSGAAICKSSYPTLQV